MFMLVKVISSAWSPLESVEAVPVIVEFLGTTFVCVYVLVMV